MEPPAASSLPPSLSSLPSLRPQVLAVSGSTRYYVSYTLLNPFALRVFLNGWVEVLLCILLQQYIKVRIPPNLALLTSNPENPKRDQTWSHFYLLSDLCFITFPIAVLSTRSEVPKPRLGKWIEHLSPQFRDLETGGLRSTYCTIQ
jgi:hypothetical protein